MEITDEDPYGIIKVDTSKLPAHLANIVWYYFDGPDGVLGAKVKIYFETFIALLEQEEIILLCN